MGDSPTLEPERGQRIADRYRVSRVLGRGGMGEVLQVWDEAQARTVALKRLRPGPRHEQSQALFEREYHTLAQLDHPGIVRVFDYGMAADGSAYYTMELLEGDDLHRRAPMPWAQAAPLLRDVAAALAVLHARQLLHRDLNGKNVRVSPQGRAKLIDFGALTRFGIPRYVVGTPPVIPPEALGDAPLDQRADLFGFGALAYATLSGKQAFAARTIDQLPLAWAERPRPLHALVELPAELEALIMELLSINPQGRPQSAAEVIDRLTAAAGLPAEREIGAARRNLPSPSLIERDDALRQITSALGAAMRGGAGMALAVQAPAGGGKTRLLSEVAIEAQLLGLLVVQVKLRALAPSGELLRRIVCAVHLSAPELAARCLAEHAPELRPFAPGATEAPAESGHDASLAQRTARLGALRRFLTEVARLRPLCLLLDDIQLGSEEDAALGALLAHACSAAPIVYVSTLSPAQRDEPEALQALRDFSEQLQLDSLGVHGTEALVQSMFGAVPHVSVLGRWLHRVTGGNPAQCLEMLRQLLEQGAIGYLGGTWILPRTLDERDLPQSAQALAQAQLARLSASERALAEALSLCRGSLTLALCSHLAGGGAQALATLDALAGSGVLVSLGDGYAFRTELTRAALHRGVRGKRRTELHRSIAATLLEQAGQNADAALEAAHHLIAGDDAMQGARILIACGLDFADRQFRLPRAVGDLEAALGAYQDARRPAEEQLALLGPLLVAGMYFDRRLIEQYGPLALAMLIEHTRLWDVTPEQAARHPLFGALCTCASSLTSVAQATCDPGRASAVLDKLEPLGRSAQGSFGFVVYEFCRMLVHMARGNNGSALAGFARILDRLPSVVAAAQMPEDVAVAYRGGLHNAMGMLLASEGDGGALLHAEALRALGHPRYATYAEQVLTLHHAYRGDMARSRAHQRKADLLSLQGAGSWRADVWLPTGLILACQLTGDVVALKRIEDQLDRLARELPTLRSQRDLARLARAVERSRHAEVVQLFEQVADNYVPGAKTGWALARANYASALNGLGRHAEALTQAEAALAALDLPPGAVATRFWLERQRALARHALGEPDAARARLEQLLHERALDDNPLLLGWLQFSLAQLAIARRDPMRFEHHRQQVHEHFCATGSPELLGRYERLLRESSVISRRTVRRPRG